ncbi:helix-turn-helix domain-containing protein [Psychromarinibacter sp. C21-152]|uniref:Helix-turn-helix domain-containing protein n=1 Tax=Psychromarinibacter sediminicola TaxID=3033385 RepID=A0AAE3T9M6_9RHOB|nr:helix-turn-helix domain-containing protein [Psychromarinibacter sediminicola]MDF0602780.1 helix-turn-helix domain-containing protein [Psychromarinibacter sediminicola]
MEEEALTQLATLSHPQRMAAYRLLMRRYPDAVPAGEIADALSLKASTSSVYLSALMEAGLIERERHGTSLRYRVRMQAVRALMGFLVNDCCHGRPDICPPPTPDMPGDSAMSDRKFNVLFICTGNSARSIFAESLLRTIAGDRFEAYSAGTRPYSELNPVAVKMLADKGHDVSLLRAKNVAEFQGGDAVKMDFVFTVCDRAANEECPAWKGQPVSAHWGMPDPVKADGTEAERILAFQHAYGALQNRIRAFTALPLQSLDRISLQKAVDDIGATTKSLEDQ